MSDRSWCDATIVAAPTPDSMTKAAEVLADYGLDAMLDEPALTDGLVLGVTYAREELAVGECMTLARDLAILGVTAKVTQAAKYEFQGRVIFTAGGRSHAFFDGDESGATIGVADLEAAIDGIPAEEIRDVIAALINPPERQAYLDATANPTVMASAAVASGA